MRFLRTFAPSLLLASAALTQAASSWGFESASLSVASRTGNDGKHKLSPTGPLAVPVTLGATDTLKVILTATEDGKGKRPHQAFLLLGDKSTGLEAAFPISVKESGKAKVDLAHKDIPVQLLTSTNPLQATVVLASFGSSVPWQSQIFTLNVELDPNAASPKYEKPVRYGKLPAIEHIFKPDAKSPPKIISMFFASAVLATVPILFGAWAYLEANLNQLSKAMSTAPISHILFFGSIVAMEAIFFGYYTSLTLFQMLPMTAVVGLVGFLSGSKALSEVQSRRLAGDR
ncbi:MAG: hypothetical protein M1818_007461 [Claussenomyces sp. TS43310]|nr:MAG: hypothetical protein M1818_007461 [Claussenomyces sp. TS43310]